MKVVDGFVFAQRTKQCTNKTQFEDNRMCQVNIESKEWIKRGSMHTRAVFRFSYFQSKCLNTVVGLIRIFLDYRHIGRILDGYSEYHRSGQ